MVPVTRSDAGALEHILSLLLEEAPSTETAIPPFRACFDTAGVTNATDFLSMEPSAFRAILFATSKDGDANHQLNIIQIKKLSSLLSWFRQDPTTNSPTRWYLLTPIIFQTWRTTPLSHTTPRTPVTSTSRSAITDFRKGVKRSVSDYQPFKEDRFWHSWHRHLLTTARSHNVDNVLNLNYTPSSPDDIALLNEQKRFVFSVFDQTVKTSDGLVFVRIHSITGDASAVYANLVDRYSKSTAAQLAASEIEEAIGTFRLDTTWKKTNLAFLNAWTTKILDLDLVLDQATSESQKRIWFKRALAPKLILSMSVSQFESSEKLTSIAFGASYVKSPFSTLYEHVKDDAIRLDQTERLSQVETRKTHSTNVILDDITKPPSPASTFIRRDGKPRPYLIPPAAYAKMTVDERSAELLRLKALRLSGVADRAVNTATTDAVAVATVPTPPRVISYASVAGTVASTPVPDSTPSVVSALPIPPSVTLAHPAPAVTPSGNLLRQILSSNHSIAPPSSTVASPNDAMIQVDGCFYRRINHSTIQYQLSTHDSSYVTSSLMDGGANGGMTGSDVRILSISDFHKANVVGIGESTIQNLPLVTAAGLVHSHRGPVIVILHQYAHYGIGHTIHSATQLRSFGTLVHEAPRITGGLQRIITPDGYHIPLSYRDGLPYMDMRPPTDNEYDSLPHIILTSDTVWTPSTLDDEFTCAELALDTPNDLSTLDLDPRTTATGEYTGNLHDDIDLILTECRREVIIQKRSLSVREPNLELLRPYFGWVPIDRIKATILHTTQLARASARFPLRKHFRSRFPAYNVHRWNEDVATDTFFCNTPAHDDGILGHGGSTMAQLYVGKKSSKIVVYPMRSESDMPSTLEDLVRVHGAPNSLFSDNAKIQIGKRVLDILRLYAIKDFQCEPHHQHQNFAERKIGDTKRLADTIMDRTGTPAQYWLLCLFYVVFLLNHLSSSALHDLTPIEAATGQRPDISPILNFRWFEPVFYKADHTFPSDSPEKSGRWCGIAETKGDALTYQILTDDTDQVIIRSCVRSGLDPLNPNLRATGETSTPILFSASDLSGLDVDSHTLKLPHFSPDELIGLTFIRDMDDGSKYRATVARQIVDTDAANHQAIKFLVEMSNGQLDEIIAYNELSDIIEDQHEAELHAPGDSTYAFRAINDHQGPLTSANKRYKGSSYNLLVHWEDGSETYEPLSVMAKADPVTCAQYAQDHDLLDTPGWKSLKRIANRTVKFARMIRQSKLEQERHGPQFKFGILLPKTRKDALQLDATNGNTLWQASLNIEMDQIDAYDTFQHVPRNLPPPPDYKFIRVHFVFDVKHDLRRKSRLVAGGHMTAPPKDSVYSGVVTLRSLRLCILLAELNGLKVEAADIGNAYLEAYTKEKVYIIAGPEFGSERHGCILIIIKALYGLRTSGARFHEKFADTLMSMGFTPCYADPDVWLKDCLTHYEYICVYVDDLAVMMKTPSDFFAELKRRQYKLKGVGDITYHLGGDFYRDPDGTLCWGAKTYIKRIVSQYAAIYKKLPKEYTSPIDKDDHPELDLSDEIPPDQIRDYQSFIGAFQWTIALGRYDIHCATMTLGRFRAAPRAGHLKRLERIIGFLKKYPDGAIRFRTGIPDYSHLDHVTYDWIYSVYGQSKEELPTHMPPPRGKPVRTSTFEDANLMHDLTTGRSVTGILHLVNQTPVEWFSKRQNCVETATYGSEFVAARIATEQIMDLRYTLRMLGVPLDGKAYMFGDNQSVITSSTIPHSSLNKRHNALAYHRVREAIASNVMWFFHISGKENPSDVLTKFLGFCTFWPLIKPFLFWRGDPASK